MSFFQRSVERSESARPQVLQVILSAFWRIVDKKGTDPFGDFGDHRHFSRGRSRFDFGAGTRVETVDNLIFDRVEPKISIGSLRAGQALFAKSRLRFKLMISG